MNKLQRRGRLPRYSVEQMEIALRSTHGLVHAAAKALGCSPRTIRRYVRRHPQVKEAAAEASELRLDLAELRLDQAVQAGEPWAICFLLKTKGKKRGFTQRHEVTGADGDPIDLATFDPTVMSTSDLKELVARLRAKLKG